MKDKDEKVSSRDGKKYLGAAHIAALIFLHAYIFRVAHAQTMSVPIMAWSWCGIDESDCSTGQMGDDVLAPWWFYLYLVHSLVIILSVIIAVVSFVIAKALLKDIGSVDYFPLVARYLTLSFAVILFLHLIFIQILKLGL